MDLSIGKQIAALEPLTVKELQARYADVFGEPTRSYHRDYLIRRIAWRIQANAEGGLSERAKRRAAELANEADLRSTPPKKLPMAAAGPRTVTSPARRSAHRLPMPGTVLSRQYRGRTIQVMVRDDGFEFEGEVYRSLSAIAEKVTGTHWNGWLFFGLTSKEVSA